MNDTQSRPTALHYAAGDLMDELATTRRMMARAPVEHYAWRPHEKSFSLGHLLVHLSELVGWGVVNLTEDYYDIGVPRKPRQIPESIEALLALFDERMEALSGELEKATEEVLAQSWTLRRGEVDLFTDTKGNVLRRWCTSHIVHHRGQLSVYLRLLDVAVPPSYGPTADEGW